MECSFCKATLTTTKVVEDDKLACHKCGGVSFVAKISTRQYASPSFLQLGDLLEDPDVDITEIDLDALHAEHVANKWLNED